MKLKTYMAENNISQSEMAERCGVSIRAIQNAVKCNYQIIDKKVYSLRWEIKESLKSGEKEND